MRNLSTLIRAGVDAAHGVDRVAEAAQVHELEAQREKSRTEDEPEHDQRDLNVRSPERDVEEDHRFEWRHDPVDEEAVQLLDEACARFHGVPPRCLSSAGRGVGQSFGPP